MSDVRQFIAELNDEIAQHAAVNHGFLSAVRSRAFSRRAWLGFATQLYPHVHFFVPYMEELLLNTFDMNAKLIVAKILLDEYGEDAAGESHPDLFRRFARSCAGQDTDAHLLTAGLDPATLAMVRTHVRLCREDHFLAGLGAIGPAHEFAITLMFPPIVEGLSRSGFTAEEMKFFSLHVDHDVEHSHMLEDAIARIATTDEARTTLRRGALASLAARHELWSAMERRMVGIETQEEPPVSDETLLDLTRPYRNVPDGFWPSS
jgi:pyrroloquinoline quinone (PQQ) biosynthesis protein C